jgi:hypothetical protein
LAGTLRLFRIGANSLWFDEAFSWIVARQPAWAILTQRLEPILPPLYHFLLHFWARLGESEAALRAFSALCGVLTIPVMYILGRKLFSPASGLAAALLTAMLPFQIYYAQEARLYALVVLLSALMLWAFVRSWQGTTYGTWVGFGLLTAINLYVHYFTVFSLAAFHGFTLLARPCDRRCWRGLLLSDLVAMVFVGPQLPSAWAQTQRVATHFWLPPPFPLQPLKTLDYLLFSHTTPLLLVPVALFFTLSIFAIVTWEAARACGKTRWWLLLLLALVLTPILVALLLSWIIGPVYLDRSFSLVTPAYVLFLGWGLAQPARRSPLPLLYGGLAVVVAISLGNHYLNPDPAKPPFRKVGMILKENWQAGDVLFHLHDSSYLPLSYYAPEVESHLLNNDPDAWLPPYTWEWAGRRVSSLDEVVAGKARLWIVVVPGWISDQQSELLTQVEAQHTFEKKWGWPSVEIRLYSLRDVGLPSSRDAADCSYNRRSIDVTYPRLAMEDWGAVQLYLYDLQGTE